MISPTAVPIKSGTCGLALLEVTSLAVSVCRICKVAEQSPKVGLPAGYCRCPEHQDHIVGDLWTDLDHRASKLTGWWSVERNGFEGGWARAPGEEVRQRPWLSYLLWVTPWDPCWQATVASPELPTCLPALPPPFPVLEEACLGLCVACSIAASSVPHTGFTGPGLGAAARMLEV